MPEKPTTEQFERAEQSGVNMQRAMLLATLLSFVPSCSLFNSSGYRHTRPDDPSTLSAATPSSDPLSPPSKTYEQAAEDILSLPDLAADMEKDENPSFWDLHGDKSYADKLVSKEENERIINGTLSRFHPDLREMLKAIPIEKRGERTALAHTRKYVNKRQNGKDDHVAIWVSDDWDSKNSESRHWKTYRSRGEKPNDPAFDDGFKLRLLIHEYLHVIESELGINKREFYEAVKEWYPDEASGAPSWSGIHYGKNEGGNRLKASLWHNLYAIDTRDIDHTKNDGWKVMKYEYGSRYEDSEQGTEEWAYTGANILDNDESWRMQDRLLELSPKMREFYAPIFHPDVLKLAPPSSGLSTSTSVTLSNTNAEKDEHSSFWDVHKDAPYAHKLVNRRKNEHIIDSILEPFHPDLRAILAAIPVEKKKSSRLRGAIAHTKDEVNKYRRGDHPAIWVNEDWDASATRRFNCSGSACTLIKGDKPFSDNFKWKYLVREYLRMAVSIQKIDMKKFGETVKKWHLDESYGMPAGDGIYEGKDEGKNYLKAIFWKLFGNKSKWDLDKPKGDGWKNIEFGKGWQKPSKIGFEAWFQLAVQIMDHDPRYEAWRRQDRISELSPEMLEFFRDILPQEATDAVLSPGKSGQSKKR